MSRLGPEAARLDPVAALGLLPSSGRPARPPWDNFWDSAGGAFGVESSGATGVSSGQN